MMKLLATLITLGLFSVLASFSCGRYCYTPPQKGYTIAQVEAVNQLAGVAFQIKGEPVYIWRTEQAAQIADALSLKPEDIDNTVDVRNLP